MNTVAVANKGEDGNGRFSDIHFHFQKGFFQGVLDGKELSQRLVQLLYL